jgi:tRNA A37 N6-isopentenylltransferase MiaA
MMVSQISNLREQVEEVRDLPRLSPDDVNSLSTALNTRVGQMIEDGITKEVTQLKIRLSSMERTSAPTLQKDVEQLGLIVAETGKLAIAVSERGNGFEEQLDSARNEMKQMHLQFNKALADSLREVVRTFEGVPA